MRFRLLVLGAAALLVSTVSACAGDADDDASVDRTGVVSDGSCTIAEPVPIGAALSLTGNAATYGESQKKGLELAVEELQGNGVDYQLKVEDDASDQNRAITVFESLIASGVSVIVGPTLSNSAKVADPVAQEASVPVLGISNTAEGITDIGDRVFRDSLTESAVVPQTVAKAKEKLGLQKVVVLYSNDDAFTQSGYDAFAKALADNGIEVVKTLPFSKADTDFRALLTDAKSANPDALVVSSLIQAAVPLVTQARELGITAPIVGNNGFNTPQLMRDAGGAAEGIIVGAAWNSASRGDRNAEFLAAFQAKYGSLPDQFAAQAYTGVKLIDLAIRADCSATREAITTNLGGLRDVDTVLGTFSFDENRDAVHPAVVQIVQNGTFAVLE